MKVERPKGTRDFTPEEMRARRWLERYLLDVFRSYGYEEILTPTFEHAKLFEEKSGEEILEEMYVFEDKKGRKLALRPEMTAPVARFYNTELKTRPHPLKLAYIVNCFRYEQPQRGRWREFWQAGVEILGSDRPEADVEVIELTYHIFDGILPSGAFEVRLGHLGILRGLLEEYGIGEDVQNKVAHLVDKGELDEVRTLLPAEPAETVLAVVTARSESEIEETVSGKERAERALENLMEISDALREAGVDHELDFSVARGLDYYTGMVFEIHVPELGGGSQCAGGGRYDDLVKELGGPDVPAVGMAIGFDRLLLAAELYDRIPNGVEETRALLIPLVRSGKIWEIAAKLRELGWVVNVEVSGKHIRKALSLADSLEYNYAVIVGERELKEGYVSVKNLRTGVQEEVPLDKLERAAEV
ncbi:histidine--tRNA ligase [Methanopyrus sp.]